MGHSTLLSSAPSINSLAFWLCVCVWQDAIIEINVKRRRVAAHTNGIVKMQLSPIDLLGDNYGPYARQLHELRSCFCCVSGPKRRCLFKKKNTHLPMSQRSDQSVSHGLESWWVETQDEADCNPTASELVVAD